MTKKISWRLSKLPTPDELGRLVDQKILTNEEARDILFEDKDEKDTLSAQKEEIKFLKKLVENLSSKDNTTIIREIGQINMPYHDRLWYIPYYNWCGGTGSSTLTSTGSSIPDNAFAATAGSSNDVIAVTTASFSSI